MGARESRENENEEFVDDENGMNDDNNDPGEGSSASGNQNPGEQPRRRRVRIEVDDDRGEERERPPLEPRRHQGGQRAVDILSVLDYLYRTGQLQIMPPSRNLRRRVSEPRPRRLPEADHILDDTSRMNKSDFRQKVLAGSGENFSHMKAFPYGIFHSAMLPVVREFRNFLPCEKVQLMQRCIPNTATKLMEIDDKIFCGLHSGNGNILLTSGQDQRIRIYDTSRSCPIGGSFRPIRNFVARDVGWSVLDVRLSTCGRFVAYSSWSDSVHLASVYDDNIHMSLELNPYHPNSCGVFSLMFSHDDSEILCGVNGGLICICGVNVPRSQQIRAHRDDVNCVAFADSSSQILYSASDDGIIKVWDRRNLAENNPKPCGFFLGHKSGITYLDPHRDGRHLISNAKDQSIKLWDLRKFSPTDGIQEAAKAVKDNSWDYRYRDCHPVSKQRLLCDTSILTYTGHSVSQTLIRARFSPFETTASRFIYTGSANGCVIIFDALTGEHVRKLSGHSGVVRDVSWHPSRPEVVSSSWDGCQLLWNYSADETDEEENSKILNTDHQDESIDMDSDQSDE